MYIVCIYIMCIYIPYLTNNGCDAGMVIMGTSSLKRRYFLGYKYFVGSDGINLTESCCWSKNAKKLDFF